MLDRGEKLTAIAELAGVKVSEVRAVLKSAGAQPVAPPDARGAPGGAIDAGAAASTDGAAADDAASRALGVGGLV